MLKQIFNQEKTQSIINVMPDSMIVWKVVTDANYLNVFNNANGMKKERWHPAFSFSPKKHIWYPFKSGHNENNIWGFHCFVKKDESQQYKEHFKEKTQIGFWNMVSAKIEKKDIMKIGVDRGNSLTILISRIIMPTYPNTDITKELSESHDIIESCKSSMELMLDNLSLISMD